MCDQLCAYNLQLYGLPVQLDSPDLEIHANGADVALCVRVILDTHTHTQVSRRYKMTCRLP